jgi:SUMO ligase MMS21 Smc5/6 complex component
MKQMLKLVFVCTFGANQAAYSQATEWRAEAIAFDVTAQTNILAAKQENDSEKLRDLADRLDILDSLNTAKADEYKIWSLHKKIEILSVVNTIWKKQTTVYPLANVLKSDEHVIAYYESIHVKPGDISDVELRKKYVF